MSNILKSKIRKFGQNSKGITIPADLLRKLRIDIGDIIEIEILSPVPHPKYEVEYILIGKDTDRSVRMTELTIPKECDVILSVDNHLSELYGNDYKWSITGIRLLDGGTEF